MAWTALGVVGRGHLGGAWHVGDAGGRCHPARMSGSPHQTRASWCFGSSCSRRWRRCSEVSTP